jgi:hypothetical protein
MDLRWRIYYVGGETFSHLDGRPEDAPGGGVAAIAQEDDVVGVAIHHQKDFYCFDEQFGGWAGMDVFGFTQYLMRPGTKIVKLGEATTTTRYRLLVEGLRKDPGLPAKSARYPWEVPV